jgi:large subunit ribosomal protein L24
MAIAKKKPAEPVRIDIRREDTVKVISGRDKGKTGRVLGVNRVTGKILVEHVMMVNRLPLCWWCVRAATRPCASRTT